MKISSTTLLIVAILVGSLLSFSSCKKTNMDKPLLTEKENLAGKGHLIQTSTYSSDVLLKWMDFQLGLYKDNVGGVGGTGGIRILAYTTIAAYESVVPGMPAYQSLASQLQAMPAMPETKPGFAYHWPASLSGAMTHISKNLIPVTGTNAAEIAAKKVRQDQAIDGFKNSLYDEFANGGASTELLDRSFAFGNDVAAAIMQWSQNDKQDWPTGPFSTLTVFDPANGKWVPTSTNPPVGPYVGKTRLFVNNSLEGIQRNNPYQYSPEPGSDFRNMVEDIYNRTYNPHNLSAVEQKRVANYYRDNPGYGSGHYLSIMKLVLAKAKPSLDISVLVFAEAGIAVEDASIGCFQVKYDQEKNYVVRPVTYIKKIIGDDTWAPVLGSTPNHPEYPSAHGVQAGAIAEVLTQKFGNNFSFANSTYDNFPGMDLGTLHYNSFWEMAKDIGDSRVYGGIHYPQSCADGNAMGKKIAENVLNKVKFKK